jgi:prophage antirepressor-like protein
MSEIKIFSSELFGEIRTMVTESGDPLFCAVDITKILGYRNGRKAISDNCKPKGVTTSDTLTDGGIQQLTYIDEGNLYRLILKSKKPEAEPFENWVCGEVLPSLRKTGGYIVAKPDDTPEIIMARALIVAQETIVRSQKELQITKEQLILQEKVITESAPKVEYFEKVLTSIDSLNTTQIAKELGMSAIRLNLILKEKGIQYKINGQWVLTAKYQNRGYTKTESIPFRHQNGSHGTQLQTVWTESGRLFVHRVIEPTLQTT